MFTNKSSPKGLPPLRKTSTTNNYTTSPVRASPVRTRCVKHLWLLSPLHLFPPQFCEHEQQKPSSDGVCFSSWRWSGWRWIFWWRPSINVVTHTVTGISSLRFQMCYLSGACTIVTICISVLVSLDTFESIPSVTCNDRMTLSWNRFDKVGDQLMRLVGNSRADVHLLPGCPPRWSHARPWFNQLKCAVVAKKLCSLNEEFWSNYSSDNCKNSGWSLMLMLQLFQLWILYYLFSIDTNY